MNPDPKESLPREILEELMEEGAEAFRNRGRFHGLPFCPTDPSQDPDRQPTGTGQQGDPAPHPSGRDLPQRSLGPEIDRGCLG